MSNFGRFRLWTSFDYSLVPVKSKINSWLIFFISLVLLIKLSSGRFFRLVEIGRFKLPTDKTWISPSFSRRRKSLKLVKWAVLEMRDKFVNGLSLDCGLHLVFNSRALVAYCINHLVIILQSFERQNYIIVAILSQSEIS